MDKKEYLAQLSASVRPDKQPKASFISPKIMAILGGLIGAIIIFIIIGVILGNNKDSLKDRILSLKAHLDNTSTIITDYQPAVKSSELRSNSASLFSVLSSTNSDLSSYIDGKWGIKKVDKKYGDEAELNKDKIESELFEAKITGILDRIYAHKMAYEISLIASEEAAIVKATKDEGLVNSLTTSYNSLENLYSKFSDFSEGTK